MNYLFIFHLYLFVSSGFVNTLFNAENSHHFCNHYLNNDYTISSLFQYDPDHVYFIIKNVSFEIVLRETIEFNPTNGRSIDFDIEDYKLVERRPYCCISSRQEVQMVDITTLYNPANNTLKLTHIEKNRETGQLYEIGYQKSNDFFQLYGLDNRLNDTQLLAKLCRPPKIEQGLCEIRTLDILSETKDQENDIRDMMHKRWINQNVFGVPEGIMILRLPPSSVFGVDRFICFSFEHNQILTSVSQFPSCKKDQELLIKCSKDFEKRTTEMNETLFPKLKQHDGNTIGPNDQDFSERLSRIEFYAFILLAFILVVMFKLFNLVHFQLKAYNKSTKQLLFNSSRPPIISPVPPFDHPKELLLIKLENLSADED